MKTSKLWALAAVFGMAASVHGSSFTIDAINDTPTSTVSLTAGQGFSVSVDPTEIWSAGDLPRWSNANGLTTDLYATGSDASGQPVGTLIGQDWGLLTVGALTAPYGALVGEIDNGPFFLVGTSYTGTAATSGTLGLMYWDSNYPDNSGSITANVTVGSVPDGGLTAGLLGGALIGLGALRRKLAI